MLFFLKVAKKKKQKKNFSSIKNLSIINLGEKTRTSDFTYEEVNND